MLYVFAVVGLLFLARRLRPRWAAWKGRSEAERSFTIRFATFTCLLGFLFLVAALHLPPLGGVLLMVPIFLAGTTLAKWWQASRARLRRSAEAQSNFERARRIN